MVLSLVLHVRILHGVLIPTQPPSCLKVCDDTTPPQYGSVSPSAGIYTQGASITISCLIGYSLNGAQVVGSGSQVETCGTDGHWTPISSPFINICTPIQCGAVALNPYVQVDNNQLFSTGTTGAIITSLVLVVMHSLVQPPLPVRV